MLRLNFDIPRYIRVMRHRIAWIFLISLCLLSAVAFARPLSAHTSAPSPQVAKIDSATKISVPIIPLTYDELISQEYSSGLDIPSNIRTTVEYDPQSGYYIIRSRIGDIDVATPFAVSAAAYNRLLERRAYLDYARRRDSETDSKRDKQPYQILDTDFNLGPLEKIFGPGGVKLHTRGTVQTNMGIKSNKTDNPALSLSSRRKTYFDFEQKIQANISADVGNRMTFNMNYNTDATFDFDSKNIRLQYKGTDDDIVKSIEAGNVSLTTGSSLIRGNTSLFGIKSTLQFGRLTATALVSQQNSESRSISTRSGVQTTPFSITADNYDADRHFFLAHFFRDNYDRFASHLPYVSSGVKITRIEIWVTNKNSDFQQSRNIVAFMDLGENSVLANTYWNPESSYPNPSNQSNNLLQTITSQYPDARNINNVTQTLAPLSAYGIVGGIDYAKIESARLLNENEYTLNSTLGYVSFKSRINTDEVLGVAYEYTYNGQVFQVGEFSSDITSTDQSIYVKMLKNTSSSPYTPAWDLMMKNVYSLGAYQIQPQNFKLAIKYLSDTTGTEINYLPVAGLSSTPILQLMGLDRIDANQMSNPDGFFDFIEGYTVLPQSGKIIFPVVEPFGRHLASKFTDSNVAKQYTYPELYDSTQVVARQYTDKNKFILTGEYQASEGSQIRLDAMNIPRGSVVVTAGGVTLVENSDYTVDYSMGIVTITNQSIIDSGQSINVTLENQSLLSNQRKTLLGIDLNYRFNPTFNLGATIMHYSEKALTEKVNIGDEVVNNTILGLNFSYNRDFQWLTDLANKIPTVNATAPSRLILKGEVAKLMPHSEADGTNKGSSFIDDFESAQMGIDLRSPYAWFLASTPYENGSNAMFPEASLSDNINYGKNRALINWYTIDRLFTDRNSSLAPGYIRADLKQLSNPYVREITSREIFPYRELSYGESSTIQTLNLSFYPDERGPYNLDTENIDDSGKLLNPERRWGGIMRRLDNTNFEQSNIEYVQFWLLNPFLDPENPNYDGGDLYLNFGDISEDILKDGQKSYENGVPFDGNDTYMKNTVWGRVNSQNSLTYAFDNNSTSRPVQDVGLDGLKNDDEFHFNTYRDYIERLRLRLSPSAITHMESDAFSPLNDPAGDNYHFYRGYDYDEQRLGILDRYKRYNGIEGNSLSPEDASDPLYQSSRTLPDVEDINQDNTLNEYERYYQYRISIRPEDLEVGKNFITDKQVSMVTTRDGKDLQVEWYQFKIPLSDYEHRVGSISDFSSIRFARMFMTGFRHTTHLRFASLELVRGEWRPYNFSIENQGDTPAEGDLDISVVNIEENSGRTPINYLLPPGVSRISDPGQSQIIQLNEQSLSLKVGNLDPDKARGIYRNTILDLRNYRRLQMWIHAEAPDPDIKGLRSGDLSLFIRLGSDAKQNFYEYEIPLSLTPPGRYADTQSDRYIVWPESNFLNLQLQNLINLKKERNRLRRDKSSGIGYSTPYSEQDPDNTANTMTVKGNPSLSDIRVMFIGIRNRSNTVQDGTVWINELKVTDFENEGGWAVDGTASLNISDLASLNLGTHIESAGFGGVDQSLNERRLDDLHQYNFAIQADLGKFLPAKAAVRAPIYYSVTKERITPKYNPLDRDVLLKDALDEAADRHEQDSIKSFAIENATVKSFSLSGLTSDVKSKNPKPWDPANFLLNYSFNKQSRTDPTTEYEYINDYRGSFQYTFRPYIRGLQPLRNIVRNSRNARYFKEWEFNWFPNSIAFLTTVSRYYYEQQTRSEIDNNFKLPVSVSKNFLWDRQLAVSWNMTRSLNFNFNSNTSARIDEPIGAVNRKLFPEQYREWKDTVMQSILHLGTPWSYNQTFSGQYRAPFSQIPAVNFLNATIGYNATYRWDRGTTIDNINTGNSIAGQSAWSIDGRISFDNLYSKIPYLRKIDSQFHRRSQYSSRNQRSKPRRFERIYNLPADSAIMITHNMRTSKVRISARSADGSTSIPITTEIVDNNKITVLSDREVNAKIVVSEIINDHSGFWHDMADYALSLVTSPRSAAIRYRRTKSLSVPLYLPDVGNVFGQTRSFGPMAPGLDFAFGFFDEDYVNRAKSRGWLMTDNEQVSPALYSRAEELHIELNLEPLRGLKIQLTSNRTDNRTKQIQFMYDDMPTTLAGSYTKTHCAIATALRSTGSAADGYRSETFEKFLSDIPVITDRFQRQFIGLNYPSEGFMLGNPNAGLPYDPAVSKPRPTSSDILIPAFLAAYSGTDASHQYLNPFPSFAHVLPNWRITYDGLIDIGSLRNILKAFTINHAYQCTYTVGSYSSYLNWISADGKSLGFTIDSATGTPIPSSPYNISSVAIVERFAPLLGASVTLNNDLTLNAEYRDSRTITLNTSAGQIVEASQKGFTAGMGYKIVGLNSVLKFKHRQHRVSNDLTVHGNFSYALSQALIRRIETAYTQATTGARIIDLNLTANYVLSRRLTFGIYFDHQINTPIVSSNSYATTNTEFGISMNLSLTR